MTVTNLPVRMEPRSTCRNASLVPNKAWLTFSWCFDFSWKSGHKWKETLIEGEKFGMKYFERARPLRPVHFCLHISIHDQTEVPEARKQITLPLIISTFLLEQPDDINRLIYLSWRLTQSLNLQNLVSICVMAHRMAVQSALWSVTQRRFSLHL